MKNNIVIQSENKTSKIPITGRTYNNNSGHTIQISSLNPDREPLTVFHEKKVKKYRRGEMKPHYPENSSYISISNTSMRDIAVDEVEEEDLSLRAMFDYDQMKQTFADYQIIADMEGVDILPETLDVIKDVFTFLTDNDNEIAEKLYDSILLVDDSYPRRFVEFGHINNPNSGFLTTVKSKARDHLVRQIKKILEFHRITVIALINDRERANHLMHLLGLSHYLMKVSVDDFDMLALACIKLLLHLNVCNEENVIHAVGYFCTVTKYVRKTIDEYYRGREKLEHEHELQRVLEDVNSINSSDQTTMTSLEENLASILSKGGTVNLWARKNYRAMKDWHVIQEEIRRNVYSRNPLAAETYLYVERAHAAISTDKDFHRTYNQTTDLESNTNDINEKCFLKWLKKGYKFKQDDNNIVYRQDNY